MITSIKELGRISKGSDIDLDVIRAKHILAISLIAGENELSYAGIELEQVKERPSRYLYCKDPSGKPGLFLSWRIASGDVKNLKKAIAQNNFTVLDELKYKKLDWISKQNNDKFESDLKLLRIFRNIGAPDSQLSKILLCLARNNGEIWDSLKTKIEEIDSAGELIITIKIRENGEWKYPGDYPDFVDIIRQYKLGSKGGRIGAT